LREFSALWSASRHINICSNYESDAQRRCSVKAHPLCKQLSAADLKMSPISAGHFNVAWGCPHPDIQAAGNKVAPLLCGQFRYFRKKVQI